VTTRPTDFPGVVIDPYRQCVVNQVEWGRFPVRVCECFSECTNPGSPLPMIVECFIYGPGLGHEDRGCPEITGGALGVTLGTLEPSFFVKLDLLSDRDLLAGGWTTANTALRFNLHIGQPVANCEVYLEDGTGKRAWVSFAPSVGAVLWVSLPLDEFTILTPGFSFGAVRYIYFGFRQNYQTSNCMMALDNVRVCHNQAGVGDMSFEADSLPYGSNNLGDDCTMLEEFSDEQAIGRVECDADDPQVAPTPECDVCVLGPPLVSERFAVHFCVDEPGPYPPSIRYVPAAAFALTANVTFTAYSWRPGVNCRVWLVDDQGRRARYDFVAVGGSQTMTVAWADFTLLDALVDWGNVAAWWTVFGTAGVNDTDKFALDRLLTNSGAVVVNPMETLTDIECGYDEEPQEPIFAIECSYIQRLSILNGGPNPVRFDSLQWNRALSVATVSQVCLDPQGYWNLGVALNNGTAEFQVALDFQVGPNAGSLREIRFSMWDEVGRQFVVGIRPENVVNPGDNLFTIQTGGGNVSEPTQESKGSFNSGRVVFWQMEFLGSTPLETYPFVVNVEGFRFRGAPASPWAWTFLFNDYADVPAFQAAGGLACYDDYRLVNIYPDDTPFSFLVGAGVTANDAAPGYPVRNVGVDRGRMPIAVAGQEVRAERVFGTPWNVGPDPWTSVVLWYRARPDPGPPARMHLVLQDDAGRTATYSFDNGSGALDADGVRQFTTARGSFDEPIGNVGILIRLVRLVKEGVDNWSRPIPDVGSRANQYSGDEVDLVRVLALGSGGVAQNGAAGGASTMANVVNGSIGAMGGDDQPSLFDGHVHHQTEPGDDPPGWPFTRGPDLPYTPEFDGYLEINKLAQGPTAKLSALLVDAGVIDISIFNGDPLACVFVLLAGTNYGSGVQLHTIRDVRLDLHDDLGGTLSIPLGSPNSGLMFQPTWWMGYPFACLNTSDFQVREQLTAMCFNLGDGSTTGFDWTRLQSYDIVSESGWSTSKTWFFQVFIGEWDGINQFSCNWNRTSWKRLLGFVNPSNQVDVGRKLDPKMTPLIALNCDKSRPIAYWGMAEGAVRAAEIVLVPAKYRDDDIVGVDGNRGYDEFGDPLPGVLEALARDTRAWYGNVAFQAAPFAGCRNIWMDICYIDEVECLGTDLTKALYQFWDTECPCYGTPEEISNLATDRWMDRILPDDQFILEPGGMALPYGYPEAIRFEYCGVPDLDVAAQDDTDPAFTFKRETPSCARPDDPINLTYGHYVARVTLTAKQAPITVNWADVLPAGEALVQGAMAEIITLVNVGDVAVREYMLRTAQLQGGSAAIAGAAVVAPSPAVTLASPPTTMDINCDTLSWHSFGSQDPNVYGVAYWAGGGRPDPVVPPGVGLWAKVWAGPGSAGLSVREQYLFADATIPAQAGPFTVVFNLGGTGIEGFSPGLPVWVFNTDFVDNPVRRISGLDIEAQESSANPDEEVTGLYGVVDSIDPVLMTVSVRFPDTLDQQVRFTTLAKACVMVAPAQSRGYYWEASPGMVDLCKMEVPPVHTAIRWGYRYWNATKYPAPGTSGAAYVCDGDGESYLYELHGEAPKDIINPVDWMDLLCSPVLETKLLNDALPGQNDVRVCDICLFAPCDIIQIVDLACTGREGGGAGYVGAVVATVSDDPGKSCASLYAVEGHVLIVPKILTSVAGCGTIDGYKTTRKARAFVRPDVARYAYSPTTKCLPDGSPVEGPNFVCVDFEGGKFTFYPLVVANNPCACFRSLQSSVRLNVQEPGIYFLKGIDKSGCLSPPSKPIKIVGAGAEPNTCGVGLSPTLLTHKTFGDPGTEEDFVGPPPAYIEIAGSTITFALATWSRVEIRASLFGFDVLFGSKGGLDAAGWTELWARDMTSGIYYRLADRMTYGYTADVPAAQTDSGAGSVCSRVMDLAAGAYTFNLYIKNGNPPSAARIRYPVDVQAWRFGLCAPPT